MRSLDLLPKVVSKESLYSGRLSGIRETLEYSDGSRFQFETIVHPGAIVVLPILDDGRLVLVRQYRHAVGEVILELPAGTLEVGESIEACAVRELEEEIGFKPQSLRSLGRLLPAPGFCSEVQHIFVARELIPSKRSGDEDEILSVEFHTVAEVEAMIVNGQITDGKSLSLFLKARLIGEI